MELYEYARPDLMAGKKILYVHGFASSGQSGTVKTLGILLPKSKIIAPDLPVDPHEAMALLREICSTDKPDLIIGTSMGGMYTEQLYGFDRILVNPAFTLADTILKNNGLGRQEFHSPRKDGETSFLVTKGLIEAFREVSEGCFAHVGESSSGSVYGLFGIHDTLVNTFDIFASHYPNAIHFDGEHYMNDSAVLHAVLPVVQWIDDAQEGRQRKTLLVGLTGALADTRKVAEGSPYTEAEPVNGAPKAFAALSALYDVYVVASPDYNHPEQYGEMKTWVETHLGVPAWNRLIFTSRKDLIIGDYLLDADIESCHAADFMGTALAFGEEPLKTWDETLVYFERLGGQ